MVKQYQVPQLVRLHLLRCQMMLSYFCLKLKLCLFVVIMRFRNSLARFRRVLDLIGPGHFATGIRLGLFFLRRNFLPAVWRWRRCSLTRRDLGATQVGRHRWTQLRAPNPLPIPLRNLSTSCGPERLWHFFLILATCNSSGILESSSTLCPLVDHEQQRRTTACTFQTIVAK